MGCEEPRRGQSTDTRSRSRSLSLSHTPPSGRRRARAQPGADALPPLCGAPPPFPPSPPWPLCEGASVHLWRTSGLLDGKGTGVGGREARGCRSPGGVRRASGGTILGSPHRARGRSLRGRARAVSNRSLSLLASSHVPVAWRAGGDRSRALAVQPPLPAQPTPDRGGSAQASQRSREKP